MAKSTSKVTAMEAALEIIKKSTEGTKFIEIENATGISWFAGKTRLVKLLKSKRGITLEINQKLDTELEKLDGMQKISYEMAHKKHLGTMKYLYKAIDEKQVALIVSSALLTYNTDQEVKAN